MSRLSETARSRRAVPLTSRKNSGLRLFKQPQARTGPRGAMVTSQSPIAYRSFGDSVSPSLLSGHQIGGPSGPPQMIGEQMPLITEYYGIAGPVPFADVKVLRTT